MPTVKRPREGVDRVYPWRAMEIGDFFFVPDRERNTFSPYASEMGARLGRRFRTRLCWARDTGKSWIVCEPDKPGAVQGVGVWRVG
jgi:hypothetical protein